MLYTHKGISLCYCPVSLPLLHTTTVDTEFWTLVMLPFSLDAYEADFAWQIPDSGGHMSALERKAIKAWGNIPVGKHNFSCLHYKDPLYHNVRTKKNRCPGSD